MTPAVTRDLPARLAHRPNRASDRIFFSVMTLLLLATILFGFARSYFLAGMVRAPLPNRLIHIHGAVFTLWMVLLLVQTALVSTGNIRIHRRLGIGGFGLAALMVVLGPLAAIDALRRDAAVEVPGLHALDARTFFIIPISGMVLFCVFAFFAYRARFRPEAHKRLILIATIELCGAGVGRWPVALLQQHPSLQNLVLFSFLLLIAGYDLFSLRRISRTTLWASGLFILVHLTNVPVGMTPAWHAIANLCIGKG